MSAKPLILDPELEGTVKDILQVCGTHMASISIRSLSSTNTTIDDPELRTMVASGETGLQQYTVSSDGEEIYHIASITKLLFAVAIVIAVEIKAKEDIPDNPYARFGTVAEKPLTSLYNEYSRDKIGSLPGNPSIYQLLVHYKGLPSSNHRLLAFDGTPILTLAEVREDLVRPLEDDTTGIDNTNIWTQYSNTNYSVIALAIEALWGRGLDTFMSETLFQPLGMNSTTIGLPANRGPEMKAWLVDSDGKRYEVQRHDYQATGAEAGPFGAYSTARDLDIFFTFLLRSFHRIEVLRGFDLDIVGKLLQMQTKHTEELFFTPFGLYTTLNSSTVGALSSNRLQFPEEPFSTYPVMPGSLGKNVATYYMAGSAVGCSCATAFLPSEKEENFAVVVLTDTSGPVDSADHILRLILRKIAQSRHPKDLAMATSLLRAKNITNMVERARKQSCERWEQIKKEDAELMKKAPPNTKDIVGVFKGIEFSQVLNIFKKRNQKTYIMISGSSTSRTSTALELIWTGIDSVKICVPPHLSIDRLGEGDWSNLTFKVSGQHTITELIRKTASGKEDRYLRVVSAPEHTAISS